MLNTPTPAFENACELGARVIYEFEGLRLNPARRRLEQVATGAAVTITPKALDALIYLVEHRGEVVPKDALLEALWPNVVVEDNSLDRCISTLRRTLGESARDNRFIATIPGRGYRFVAVTTVAAEPAPIVRPRSASRAIATLAAALVILGVLLYVYFRPTADPPMANQQPDAIAVLPFRNDTTDDVNDFLAAGMADELTQQLARIPGLRVVPPSVSAAAWQRTADPRELAAELGVSHVLEASVDQSGSHLLVRARLTDARTGYQAWAHRFEREADELAVLEEEIAATVVQSLFPGVHAVAAEPARRAGPAASADAYRLFLQANAIVGVSSTNLHAALDLYDRAIALDPQLARAWAARASTVFMLLAFGVPTQRTVQDAEADVARALALDPDLPAAFAIRGMLGAVRGRFMTADADFQQALVLAPHDPAILDHYGIFLAMAGKVREGLAYGEKAYALAPLSVPAAMNRAMLRSLAGDDSGALADLASAVDRGAATELGATPEILSSAAFRNGRHDEAAKHLARGLTPQTRAQGLDRCIELVYAALDGSIAALEARRALDDFSARIPAHTLDQGSRSILVHVLAAHGDLDRAFMVAGDLIEEMQRTAAPGRFWALLWSPQMRPLVRDPRFADIAARLELFDYWRAKGPPDGCRVENSRLVCA